MPVRYCIGQILYGTLRDVAISNASEGRRTDLWSLARPARKTWVGCSARKGKNSPSDFLDIEDPRVDSVDV